MTCRSIGRGQVSLQPKKLRNFHFRRDRAADITKNVILHVINLAGFGNCTMVHPNNDIAPLVAGATHRQRIGTAVEHNERTGRIETQALDSGWRDCSLRHRGADRSGARSPDFGRRLLDDAARFVPSRDRMPGGCQQVSLLVKYSGARTRRSDIHADESLPHCNPVQDQRKLTSTYSLRRRGRRSRSSGLRRQTPETGRRTRSRRPPPSGPSAYRRSRHRTSAGCF